MTALITPTPPRADENMANKPRGKKPKGDGDSKPGRTPIGKQIGVRLGEDLQAALEEIGEGMGLDLSSVVRMICTEKHGEYLVRVRQRRQQEGNQSEG